MLELKPIQSEQDYDQAIREIARFFESEPVPGTPDGDRFEAFSTLIKEYEDNHYPVPSTRCFAR